MDYNETCVAGEIALPLPYNYSDNDSGIPIVSLPAWEIAVKVIFYIVAMFLDFVGNTIVIMIILLNRKMRTTTNLLLLNLAVSDLMVGMFCMWVHVGNQLSTDWPFGAFMCKFSTFCQVMSVTASILTLTVISIERFIAVVFPFRPHWTPSVTGIIIGITWFLAITTASPQLYVRTYHADSYRDRTVIWCGEDWDYYFKSADCDDIWLKGKVIYYLLEGIVMYFLPVVIILVAYSIIAFRLLIRKSPGSLVTTTSSAQEKAKRKVMKMLVIVVLAFIICWTPQQIILLYDILQEDGSPGDYYGKIKYAAVYIAYFNSALNPILYGGFNENFRHGFIEAFKCFLIQKRNKIGPASVMSHWTGKKHSDEDGNSSGLKKMSGSHLISYTGQDKSANANLQDGYLHPPEHVVRWGTTRSETGKTPLGTQNDTKDASLILSSVALDTTLMEDPEKSSRSSEQLSPHHGSLHPHGHSTLMATAQPETEKVAPGTQNDTADTALMVKSVVLDASHAAPTESNA